MIRVTSSLITPVFWFSEDTAYFVLHPGRVPFPLGTVFYLILVRVLSKDYVSLRSMSVDTLWPTETRNHHTYRCDYR